MAKRYKSRAFKKNHSYTLQEVADNAGANLQTVRAWTKAGLRCLRDRKPFLVLGSDVIAFIDQLTRSKTPLHENELYCLKCRAGHVPWGKMADYTRHSTVSGRLTGICPVCESVCQRFVSPKTIRTVAPDLDVAFEGADESLIQSDEPPSGTHISE